VLEATKSPIAKEALDHIAAFYVIEEKARFAPAGGKRSVNDTLWRLPSV